MPERIWGKVVQLVTDEELILNIGESNGVNVGDLFRVLDPRTLNVKESGTNRDLGSIEREKARVIVTAVNERMSLARVQGRNMGISGISRVLSGDFGPSRLTVESAWPDGVKVSDPAVKTQPVPSEEDVG